jgi:predicted ATPase
MALKIKPYLRSVEIDHDRIPDEEVYPFNIPSIRALQSLEFHEDVTFIVGENGSGKSTLVEAIAMKMGFGVEGGTKNVQFSSAETTSELHKYLYLERSYKPPTDYYFLRAESFYNVATYMEGTGYLRGYGGKSLHEQSHGESFMATLTHKLQGHGFYIFDEPEAALSPARQLAALVAIHELVKQDSQFIIATHSPILMAYPNAKIYLLGEDGIDQVAYNETEHYKVTKNFLDDHERMIGLLLGE